MAEAVVRRLLGSVMKLPGERIDPDQPFGTLGLDSLMAIELRNRVEVVARPQALLDDGLELPRPSKNSAPTS